MSREHTRPTRGRKAALETLPPNETDPTMNTSNTLRAMLLLALATLIAVGNAPQAEAAGPQLTSFAKFEWPKKGEKKFELKKYAPKVKFKASGKLTKTSAKVQMYATITFAGKTKKISIFNMGIAKKGKSVKVQRKIGKMTVSLKVSWSGARSITIKGTARYLQFKVPVPTITLRV